MAHYDIFRDQLGIKYPAYGHALWEPSPGRLYSPVEVGDVGYIREGRFHRLFNAHLPADHPSHQNFGVPELYEPLTTPGVTEHIDRLTLGSHDFCSGGVTKTSTETDIFAAAPPDPGRLSYSCTRKQGAVLCLPVQAQREDTIARGAFRDYIIRHIRHWFAFARLLGLGIDQMEEIILVTGRDRTRSCTNIVFSETDGQADARVSFGVEVSDVGIRWNFAREHTSGAVLNPGRSGTDLPEDQCIFIRGWRIARTLILLRKLRGAAGPSDLGGYGPEPSTEAVFVPTVLEYRDPLHGLLEYLAEQAPDSDMVLVHDDDLGSTMVTENGTSLETLHADVVKGHLQSSNPQIQQVSYDRPPSDETRPNTDTPHIRVAMLVLNESKENIGPPPPPAEPSTVPSTANVNVTSEISATHLQTSPHVPGTANVPAFPTLERQSGSENLTGSTQLTPLGQVLTPDFSALHAPLQGSVSVQPSGQDQQADNQAVLGDLTPYLVAPPQLLSPYTCPSDSSNPTRFDGSHGSLPLSNISTSPTMSLRTVYFASPCGLPGCFTPAFFDQQIQERRDYCQEHIYFAVSSGFAAPCQQCGIMPARLVSTFCSKACDDAHLRWGIAHHRWRYPHRQPPAVRYTQMMYCEMCRRSGVKPGVRFCSVACARADASSPMQLSTAHDYFVWL